ncbi:hypothetical protein PCASD_09829 [Puccinia coronata f. sp. avenae]|uniref:Uncharacterized protein n=1 Tax=Puccinia coronata f. sp. avenae TaxID=200324 RepID=A0A2N5U9S8_9BASI|nr:hypothetical protein PCASD_09829 [Puccinia coronata f. sp. avenae]
MEATLAAASHSSGTAAEISKATAASARTLSGAHTPTLPAYSEVQIDAIKAPHLPPLPGSTRQCLENGRLSPADSPHSTDLSLTSHLPSPEPPKINPIVLFKERFFWPDFEKLKGIPDLPDFANRFIEDLLNRPEKWKSIMQGKAVVNDVGDIKKKTGETLSNIRQLILGPLGHDGETNDTGELKANLWFSNQGPLGHDGETNDTGELKANLEATRTEQSDWRHEGETNDTGELKANLRKKYKGKK